MVANPPATYFIRAQGDSMVDAGINDGDLLVVDFSQQSKHNDIVIAKLDESFTVKRLVILQKDGAAGSIFIGVMFKAIKRISFEVSPAV